MDIFALTMRLKEEGAAQVKASVDRLNRSFDEGVQKGKAYDLTIGSLKDTWGDLVGAFAAAAVFTRIIQETSDAAASAAQLNAVLKSTQGIAGQSADALNKHAQALSYMSAFDDDAITGAQSLLLTFTKIQGDTFPKATQAVLDMATAMGTDLKGAAIQVGKALNDPILGVGALSRAGVQFNEQQKNMIALLVESNDIISAQEIILGELKTQFEGSAQAAANTLGGAIKQLNNELGNLLTLSNDNASTTTRFVNLLTDAIRGLNDVVTDLGDRMPTIEGRLGSFFSRITQTLGQSNILMVLAAMGGATRTNALEALASEAGGLTLTKPTMTFGTTGEGTKVPLSRAAQIDQLLRLADVTKLNASQTALLRDEAARLTAEMRAQGIEVEKQIELGTKLKAIQDALAVKKGAPLKLAEVSGLGLGFMGRVSEQIGKLPMLEQTFELAPKFELAPEATQQGRNVYEQFGKEYVDGFQEMTSRIGDMMGNMVVDSIAGAFENLTAVGGSIKSAFKTLTAGLLSGLGGMLIEFGRYVIIAGKLMGAVRESLKSMNPVAGVAAGLAMIAIGGMLRGAASRAFGGGPTSGGGVPSAMAGGVGTSGGAMTLAGLTYGPTAAGSAATIQQIPAMNVTIIGPNDPSAQRQMQELMRNAKRRGEA